MSQLLSPTGFQFRSNVANWGTGNTIQFQGGDAYILKASGASGTSATRIFGEASVLTAGNLARIIITAASTNASAVLTVWDSNDPAVTTNKRLFTISLYGGTTAASQAVNQWWPVEWAFTDGLCAQITDAATLAQVAFYGVNIVKRGSNFH